MMGNCKNCGSEHNNGTNFCTKKCRKDWIGQHNVKGAKRKYSDPLSSGYTGRGVFDCDGNDPEGY